MKNLRLAVIVAILGLVVIFFARRGCGRGSECETIFRQTSVTLSTDLEALMGKGSLLLDEAQMQNLTERSEMMAMNLRACCIGAPREQFMSCQENVQKYQDELQSAAKDLDEADAAKRDGDADLLKQKVDEATSALDGLVQQSDHFTQMVRRMSVKTIVATDAVLTRETDTPGVVAEVTRLADTDGMITVHARFRNVGDSEVAIWCYEGSTWGLIDEKTRTHWNPKFSKDSWSRVTLQPGGNCSGWAKFEVDPPFPEKFTVVVETVQPFEGVTFTE